MNSNPDIYILMENNRILGCYSQLETAMTYLRPSGKMVSMKLDQSPPSYKNYHQNAHNMVDQAIECAYARLAEEFDYLQANMEICIDLELISSNSDNDFVDQIQTLKDTEKSFLNLEEKITLLSTIKESIDQISQITDVLTEPSDSNSDSEFL